MSGYAVKGWCPSALRPMLSGDGLLVRIRPRMACLSPDQARGLAEAARHHGNSVIDLTARGAIQLRGISEAAHPALIDDLGALGLVDPATEAARNLIVTPFWQSGDGTEPLALALEQALQTAANLPDKFGVALDCGSQPVLAGVSADIRVERDATGGLIIRPDGAAFGRQVCSERVAEAVLDLARWFMASGGADQGRGRMAAHLAAATLPTGYTTPAAPALAQPQPGPGPLGFCAGFEFGQTRAEVLAGLADAGQALRLTPWRMLLIEGASAAPDLPGLITAPDDPRLRVTACVGAPFCVQGQQPTRDLARRLAIVVPQGQHLHVSGCAKGCAHPGPADMTLCGTAEGFAVIRNGKASAGGKVTPASYDAISRHLLKAL